MAFILFDEHLGQVHPAGEVQFAKPSATIRELIRARVELELEKQRDQAALALSSRIAALIRPGPVEVALNGDRGAYGLGSIFLNPASGRNDVDALVKEAEKGFALGHYFILVDERQAEGLDEAIDLGKTGEATFLLLTPLQGG